MEPADSRNYNCQNKKSWGEMKNYEYPKENTRYSVLFGMDSTLNLTMCSACFYLHKRIHNSISVKLLLKIKKYGFYEHYQEIIYL